MKIKSLLLAGLLAVGFGTQAQAYDYEQVKGDPMATRIYTLPNGLKVYLSVNKDKPRIQTYIAVRTGSRNDPAQTTGLAHYLEHLMFKGTLQFGTTDAVKERPYLDDIERRYEHYRTVTDPAQRRQLYHEIDSVSQIAANYFIPNEYDKLMSSIGAKGTNAYTSNDITCYVEDIPANEVDNWARIQADRFQNMVIRGFHTELEAVYEEYNMGLTSDSRKVWQALASKLFPTHPYGTQSTIGTQDHLKNPSITNIKNYYHRYYVPNNVAICMAGDFDPDAVVTTIDRYFGAWKGYGEVKYPQYAPLAPITAPVDTTVVGPEAASLMMGWRFEAGNSMQADTLEVISNMLSNGNAGLFDLDINQPLLCQGAGAGFNTMRDYSQFIVVGQPNEGQTLTEVRDLILAEIEKLKRGEFSDKLLPSVVNNMKLDYLKSLDSNASRADRCVDAFINGQEWKDVVAQTDRLAKLTKQDVMDFARRHFLDNYAVVYKTQGTDTTQKKIEKPQITPIPANRNLQSQFVADIAASKVTPIQPQFVDFDKDMARTTLKNGQPLYYIQNKENGLFSLYFVYPMGEQANKWLPFAASYLDYVGTDRLSAKEVKQRFYELACNYYVNVSNDRTIITLSGLDENMKPALTLLEDVLAHSKGDADSYAKYVATVLKGRKDDKANQRANFSALRLYGMYGEYNAQRNVPDSTELATATPKSLTDIIAAFSGMKHRVMYYGPMQQKQLATFINKNHRTAKKLVDAPAQREYTLQRTTGNEVLLAPYDAKNIYMIQYNNTGKKWNVDEVPTVMLFNEYFGHGMNAVVFQELRETRGLAYSAYATYSQPSKKDDDESAYTSIISQNDKMMDCIRTFNEILDTIPQSEKAFDLAKQSLLKRIASTRTTKSNIFFKYLNAERMGVDYDMNRKVFEAVPQITLSDIVKFELDNMAHRSWRYLILGDEKNLDMKALETIAPVKRVSTEEIFGY